MYVYIVCITKEMDVSAKLKVDRQAILKKIQLEQSDKKKITLYLSEQLYEDFKTLCGAAPASRVVEELMWQFVHPKKMR